MSKSFVLLNVKVKYITLTPEAIQDKCLRSNTPNPEKKPYSLTAVVEKDSDNYKIIDKAVKDELINAKMDESILELRPVLRNEYQTSVNSIMKKKARGDIDPATAKTRLDSLKDNNLFIANLTLPNFNTVEVYNKYGDPLDPKTIVGNAIMDIVFQAKAYKTAMTAGVMLSFKALKLIEIIPATGGGLVTDMEKDLLQFETSKPSENTELTFEQRSTQEPPQLLEDAINSVFA